MTTLSIGDIYRAKRKLEATTGYREPIHGVRLAPDVLHALRRELPFGLVEPAEERYARAAVWGIPCIVDASLPRGTWEAAYDRETWLRWKEQTP